MATCCLDCGNRTKQVRHGLAWCLVNDSMVILAAPNDCQAFTPRIADLPEASPEIVDSMSGKWIKPSQKRKKRLAKRVCQMK